MSTPTNYPHIETRADGKVWLIGTQTKVIEVALDRLAHHWDADEIQRQHPHLTLGQIHSCLAYYHDHEEEMDQAIEEQLRAVSHLRGQHGESVLRAKSMPAGLLRDAPSLHGSSRTLGRHRRIATSRSGRSHGGGRWLGSS